MVIAISLGIPVAKKAAAREPAIPRCPQAVILLLLLLEPHAHKQAPITTPNTAATSTVA